VWFIVYDISIIRHFGNGLSYHSHAFTDFTPLPVPVSFMISTLRSQVGFAAAVAHARLRLSRLELTSLSGVPAAPPAVTRLPHAPSFRRPPLSRRGEALWERAEAGSGLLGAASSESAAGSGWLRACGC
jgi:hypothetical protein